VSRVCGRGGQYISICEYAALSEVFDLDLIQRDSYN